MRRVALVSSFLLLAACSPSEEEAEKACFDRLAADFDAARLFGGEQAKASSFGSDDAISWRGYALTAAESALSIYLIYADDDRNACDYVSAGPRLMLDPSP